MNMVYGYYELDMNCAEFDILLQSLREKAMKEAGANLTGLPILTLTEYNAKGGVGYTLIGTDDKSSIVGVAYKTSELSRLWVIPTAEHKHSLFIDGYPTIVENVDLIYEKSTGNIISPANNDKIIVEGIGL